MLKGDVGRALPAHLTRQPDVCEPGDFTAKRPRPPLPEKGLQRPAEVGEHWAAQFRCTPALADTKRGWLMILNSAHSKQLQLGGLSDPLSHGPLESEPCSQHRWRVCREAVVNHTESRPHGADIPVGETDRKQKNV